MRRSAGWVVCEVSRPSSSGSGRLCRLFVRVIVGDERDDVVRGEQVAAVQVAELYEECYAGDGAAGVLDELAHGAGGTTGGEEVVGDEDAGARSYGVGVGLEGIGAVFEVVSGGDRLAGELVRLPGQDEALASAVGEGSAEDEAGPREIGDGEYVALEVFGDAFGPVHLVLYPGLKG